MLTDIVNDRLSTGSVPDSLKCAFVKPLLKKEPLDPNVSGLSPFVSKLLGVGGGGGPFSAACRTPRK